MRQDLGQPAAQYLRRLFLAARDYLRLRFASLATFARTVCLARAQHVALSRVAAAAGGVSALPPCWIYPAGQRAAPRRQDRIARLFVKNDAVCLPTLSFKDRVVAVALANARSFGFDNGGLLFHWQPGEFGRGASGSRRFEGVDLHSFRSGVGEDSGTQVFGAELVRINGSYDHVNRLCSQIADEHRWGFVNVNLRPYYSEGSKTVGYEIAEQLGWRLPDNIVVPMAGGSLITKIKKAFDELILLGLVDPKPVKFFGAQPLAARRFRRRSSSTAARSNRSVRRQLRGRWRSATRPMDITR